MARVGKGEAAPLDPAFGAVPAGAVEWGIRRADVTGAAGVLELADASGVSRRRWALSALSMDAIRDAFGAGLFRVQWYGLREGRPAMLGQGAPFRLSGEASPTVADGLEAPAAPAAARPPPAPLLELVGGPGGVGDFIRLWQLVQGDADRRVAEMRAFLESNASGGGAVNLDPVLEAVDGLAERVESLEKQLAEAIRIVAGAAGGAAAPGGAPASGDMAQVRHVVDGVADLIQRFRNGADGGNDPAGG